MTALLAKEFLTRLRSRGFLITLWLYLVGIGLIYLMTTFGNSFTLSWKLGRTLFHVLMYGQGTLLTFIALIYASFSITEERGRRTFDSLFTSTLSPWQIVCGKTLSLILTLALLLISAMPIAALSFFYGNLSLSEFFSIHLYLLAYVSGLAGTGIWISAVYRRTFSAVGAALFFILSTLIVTATISFFSGLERLLNVYVTISHLASGSMLYFAKWSYSPLWIACILWILVALLGLVRARQKFEGEPVRRAWRWQAVALVLFLILTMGNFGHFFMPMVFEPGDSTPDSTTTREHGIKLTQIIPDGPIYDSMQKFYVFQMAWLILWILILGADARTGWINPWPAAGLLLGFAGAALMSKTLTPIAGDPRVWTGLEAVYLSTAVYLLALLLVASLARRRFDVTVIANGIIGAFVFVSLFIPTFSVHMNTLSYTDASYLIPAAVRYKETYWHPLAGYGLLCAGLSIALIRINRNPGDGPRPD